MWPAYVIALLFATALGAAGGYRYADGQAAKRELAAAQEAKEQYHAKEIDYNTAAVNLEQARAALAAQRTRAATKVQEITARPSYQRDCLDADGVRAFNDAIGEPANTSKPPDRLSSPDATR